ncbi:uncharacterized protein LOC129580676 [Paramacrobiotus metropolitanus]|uniref:uncharacterized protein LOC129580676 n=1 Tax=Paramacrobiotus metropolitanus TaxID=2943436 RepID=UPI0024456A4A|nr:uncharacterized protein LOC129580676 [Paramacrobiotus metropolitanus]
MVTTTTKTLNYSITKGSSTNSVNATITSTPGFNSNYLGKIPGILKLLEFILAAVAMGLVASRRQEMRITETADAPRYNAEYMNNRPELWRNDVVTLSYLRELFLVGEVYFLCAHSAVLTVLAIVLIAYLFHTTSAMIVPKATTVENVMNMLLALMLIAAGIVEIVMTEKWKWDGDNNNRPLMYANEEAVRVAAGAIALLNGILFLVSFFMSKKELEGPKTL